MNPGRNPRTRPLVPVAVALAALLAGCSEHEAPAARVPPPTPEVVVAPVEKKTVPVLMEFAGTVRSVRTVDIVPQVSGKIEKVGFADGSIVTKGAPLYSIDPRPFQADLDAAQAQLKKDEASVHFWLGEEKRYTRLAKAGAGSQEKKEEAVARLAETRAAVVADKAAIDSAKLDLAYTDIVAPLDGRVEETRVYEGDVVTAQKDVMTTLVQLDPVHVVFNVSRRQALAVEGMQSAGRAPDQAADFRARVRLSDGTEYPPVGKVDYVSARIDPTTDTLTARAVFPNQIGKTGRIALVPGQYVPLTLTAGEQPDALLIPQAALVESQVGAQVFVVDKDGKVEARTVEVDRAYDRYWILRKGVEAGERVVVEGVQKVRSGMTVKVKADGSAAPATG